MREIGPANLNRGKELDCRVKLVPNFRQICPLFQDSFMFKDLYEKQEKSR